MRFLHTSGDGRPWRPTRAWLKSEADPPSIDKWSLHMERPAGSEGVFDVSNFKLNLLSSATGISKFKLQPSDRRSPEQEVRWAKVLERYLATTLAPFGEGRRAWVLMPSLSDPESHARYRDAILAAHPKAHILPEPEMVLEYFRLVKGVLTLKPDHNGLYLVVDSGASTTHLTFVLTNRNGTVVDAQEGRRRIERLRPVQGRSAVRAGQWVDGKLATELGISLPDRNSAERPEMLRRIEEAKIEVSRRRRPLDVPGGSRPLTEAMLRNASTHLWGGARRALPKRLGDFVQEPHRHERREAA